MPKGPRKFQFLVDATGLTRFGGLILFQEFCKSLRLRYLLQHYVRWPTYHHRSFHPADIFLAHVFAIVAGIGRIENTQSLLHNGLLPPILGLPDFPHRDTLRTFLWRFHPQALRSLEAVHDRVRAVLLSRLGLRYDAMVDADTTALITYGSQEGVVRGYIPKRRHQQGSYAPILASEGHSGLSLGAQLRAGNVHAVTGSWPFLAAQLAKLPTTIAASRTRVRLDGAFYDRAMIQPLDERSVGYVIVARMTQPLRNRMVAARYHEFRAGWEAAEFTYTPFHWNQEHRFVAVRRP
ncbi:MAG: transposase, partial [Candidatus Omnitrophica bacterium]|nr:transposase [Candidatus Omnitrophota bacterium]